MQISYLHKNVYKLYTYARTQESLDHYRKAMGGPVQVWGALKKEGTSDSLCAQVSGISRATYFRRKKILVQLARGIHPPSKRPRRRAWPRWGLVEKNLVLSIRRDNPTFGKDKIGTILRRDHGLCLSNSTIGRILRSLMAAGLVTKSPSAPRKKRKRLFGSGHASPWAYKQYKAMQLGERVQIDHMTVTKNGVSMKHFQAWERKSKHLFAAVYSNATSRSAKRFLEALLHDIPYKLVSIQVDGGCEFRGEFEEACRELKIPLIVLPPAKPKYNGGVERGNRIFREELYAKPGLLADSMVAFRAELSRALHKYNTYRPHHALQYLTPMQYIHRYTFESHKSHLG